jgi:tetratricopeptide (TPR) repeat protein
MSDAASSPAPTPESPGILAGKRIVLVGKLASMPKREAARLVRGYGGTVLDKPDPSVHLVVVGEAELPLPGDGLDQWLDAQTRLSVERGDTEILGENQFWQRLGLVDPQHDIHHLYTPAMLAELLKVSVAVIRRWHRRGLIVPAREVRRLAYFDFREVAAARQLAELLAAGVSPRAIERKLEALGRYVPGVQRPLAQLSVIVEGKAILLRQGDGLIEPGGQLRFDFEDWTSPAQNRTPLAPPGVPDAPPGVPLAPPVPQAAEPPAETVLSLAEHREAIPAAPISAEQACRMAAELEEAGELEAAVEMYRVAMAAAGPSAEICFQVAELLYRQGDNAAARERYYMAIELDEDYVEARANLGCVLSETGYRELAVAAFQGALAYHAGYADVHYHLARTLDELGRRDEAAGHWQSFLELAPDSPWADEARIRLE